MKKDVFNLRLRSRWLLVSLLALLAGTSPAWADELTVANGETTNSYTPFDAGNADYGIKGEYIIPAEELTAMTGMSITKIKLYAQTNNTSTKPNYGPFQIFLKEVENATPYSQSSSAFQGMDDATIVYEGTVVVASKEMLITFDTPYDYKGGNLLIGFYKDKGGYYYSNKFYGVNQDGYTGCSSYSSSGISSITTGTGRSFIPKTTFTYEATSAYKKPATLTYTSVTSNSAVINWTAGSSDSSETGWDLEYKTSASDTWTEVHGLSASTFTYSLTSLEANTSYDVRVRAIYSAGESDWKAISFKTEKISTPATGFTDNFETDKGWELINGTQTNKWVRSTATNNGGSNALYISNDGGTTNAYSHSASMTFATKLFAFEAGDFTIAYDWKANGESNYDFLRVALVPASEELTAGTTPSGFAYNGLPTGWQALDGGKLNLQTDWQSKSIDITIESAGAYQIVFAWKNDGSGGNQTPAAAIDNFKIIGAAPVLELGGDVAGTTLAFGSIAETTNKTITITNVGKVAMENITLTETADEDNVFAYAALPKTTLDPNESMDVLATFSGTSAKDYTGTFRVAADDCDPIDVTVTATYSNSPATMAVTLNEEAVGASVAFGSVGKQAQKTFTVTNGGDQTLHITSIASNNTTDFTVAPATLEVAGHSSETFTVTFVYDAEALDAEKTATITVTASNEGIEAKQFTVTGTRIEQWSEDFSGGTLPDGWEITNGTYWKIQDGVAKGSYSYGNFDLYTPSLVVEEGATLTFDYRMTSTYRSLDIQYSKDNGAWTNYATISYSGLTLNQWYTYNIENLTPGNYKFRFGDSNYDLDNFQGFKRNLNDPKMGIYTDAECTVAATTAETKDFGFATTDQTATYYIKNDGTGTMTLSKGDDPAGFTVTLDRTSVAAGEHATLTITMPAADNAGYHSGNIVVTATDLGDFTVAASGVIRDANKMYLDFSSDNIPATWTPNDWMKDNGGFIKTGQYGYSNTSMETSTLTAEAGEQLIFVAKNGSTSNSYTFGVKYKKVGDAEWSDLIASANIGTSWTTLVGTIAEAGDYLFQINGYYASIQRIYGLSEPSEPVMVVYDNEEVAGSTHNFGNVSDDADATWTLTVKNEGKATLTGLAAALSGENAAHYSVEVSATELAVNATTTITVKQLKDNIGAHSATLTISADDPVEDQVITLSGYTYDHNKMFVDFEGGSFPAGWTTNSWTVATTSGNQHARAGYTASSLITTPLTVGEDESLVFKAKRQYSNSAPYLQIRYTTNGGVTWSEYADYASQVTTSDFTNITLSGINAGTAIVEIYGRYVDIDDIIGFAPTTAPVLSLTESAVAVANGSTKEFGNLTEDGVATYTLSNTGTANLVSTVATTGVATVAISGEGEGITISENTVTLEPGKSATITLTVALADPYGEKDGNMTITSEGWVGTMTVNYTATTIDPTTLYIDFTNNVKPEGWYQDGWSFTGGEASAAWVKEKVLVSQKLSVSGTDDVLSFDVKAYNPDGFTPVMKVEYSTDRKAWTEFANQPADITTSYQTYTVSGLTTGEYYVRFTGSYVYLDNIIGWHKVNGIEHDFYMTDYTLSTNTALPGSEYTATIKPISLRADETVTAALWIQKSDESEDAIELAELTEQSMTKDVVKEFTLTGNLPNVEGEYKIWANVWNATDNDALTDKLIINVQHTRTLEITEFTRTSEAEAEADDNNQFDATFTVTVENTGTVDLNAEQVSASILINSAEGEVQLTKVADAALPMGESVQLTLTGKVSAGAGGEVSYYAQENLSNTVYATPQTVTVTAQAALFAIDTDNNTTKDFGLVTVGDEAKQTYTITNSGTKALVVSFDLPEGFSMTGGNTIKFTDSENWGDIHVYYWNDGPDWPGNSAIYNGKNELNQNQYLFVVPEGTEGIIFNGNGRQTVDIMDFDVEGYYSLDTQDDLGHYNVNSWGTTPTVLTIAAGESADFSIVMNTTVTGKKSGDVTITTNAADVASFTIPVKGRVIAADTWTEDFATEIPSTWQTGISYNKWTWDEDKKLAYSGGTTDDRVLTTPRLAAEKDEVLTYDLSFRYSGYTMTVQYSTDYKNWIDYETLGYEDAGEQEFVAPETGNYYLRFKATRYAELDNFVGFHLAPLADLTLVDTEDFSATAGRYDAVTVGRSFNAGWATVVLPFAIDAATVSAKFGAGTKLYDLTGYENDELTFTLTTTIEAGKPYLMNLPANIEANSLTFSNVVVESTVADYEVNGAWFKGNYEASMSMAGKYGVTGQGKLAKGGSSSTMKGFRAYIELPDGAPAARIMIDDTATGIKYVLYDEAEMNGIYNLQGQRVDKARKGLYIVNGQKVFKK